MIALNFFETLGKFFTEVLFAPYDAIRSMKGWWGQNSINGLFIIICFIALIYWLIQLRMYQKKEA